MDILLNGKPFSAPEPATVLAVLQAMGLTENTPPQLQRGFAVCLNNEVILRHQHGNTVLKANDKMEVIRPVGGG